MKLKHSFLLKNHLDYCKNICKRVNKMLLSFIIRTVIKWDKFSSVFIICIISTSKHICSLFPFWFLLRYFQYAEDWEIRKPSLLINKVKEPLNEFLRVRSTTTKPPANRLSKKYIISKCYSLEAFSRVYWNFKWLKLSDKWVHNK